MLEFRQKEVVFKYKEDKGIFPKNILSLEVFCVGNNCELGYEPGDKVLIDLEKPNYKFNWEDDYLVFDERHIICYEKI